MRNQIAFIDEFGNNGLDFEKEGVSNTFIVTAIIVSGEQLKGLETELEKIRKSNFQTGEIKSSKVGGNDTRRLNIVAELNSLDYHIFSIVIDKTKLTSEGFQYKGSFYKFLHSLVDRELFKTFPDLLVVADEHGGNDFKKSFLEYMKNRHIPNLFEQSEFRLSNSKSELMVQLADFITGTVARCYEPKKLSPRKNDILKVLRQKIIEIRIWPPDYKPMAYDPGKDFANYDPTISSLGLNLASQFLDKFGISKVPYIIDQCTCLKYLLFHFRNINPETYVTTFELLSQIEQLKSKKVSMHYFRSKVIAKLRDNGVILASSNKGYKLPSSSMDLYDFVNHSNSYIQPMMDRLLKCRNQIKLATKNEMDIFDHEEFKYLSKLNNNVP
tara:strand:- start:283 stop:1434 length:1152 start_codon:yes stop_codon:yes gene_type:complete